MKIGEYLLEKSIITKETLEDALLLQKDNPDRVLGEILVTLGVLTKEDLIMVMEMYMVETGSDLSVADEWLDQEEIDLLMTRSKNNLH